MLSSSIKRKVSLEQYTKWWSKKVDKVIVENIKELSSNVVQARLKYYMKNGKITCSLDTFALLMDHGAWLIDKQKYKNCIP